MTNIPVLALTLLCALVMAAALYLQHSDFERLAELKTQYVVPLEMPDVRGKK